MGKIKQMPKTKGNNQINKKNIQMTKLKKKKKEKLPSPLPNMQGTQDKRKGTWGEELNRNYFLVCQMKKVIKKKLSLDHIKSDK